MRNVCQFCESYVRGMSMMCGSTFVSGAFSRIAGDVTYPLLTFLSAGVVNLFVPSGGGVVETRNIAVMDSCL